MGLLPFYKNLDHKKEKFSQCENSLEINTVKEFNEWYDRIKIETKETQINHMFRGMGEAKYKLLTSSQRFWITNEIEQWWQPKSYLEYIQHFVDIAKKKTLFKKAFDYYGLSPEQVDFPILSILQHYGSPTPLIDWSYNLDVALFFATNNVSPSYSSNDIDQYSSIYHIDKEKQRPEGTTNNQEKHPIEFSNLLKQSSQSHFSKLSTFFNWEDSINGIFYISDFENKQDSMKPITTFFNQNIIPQEGLFIFNPFPNKPLEDCFTSDQFMNNNNFELFPFHCVNIKKDLSKYIRRKIKSLDVDSDFIYPDLKKYSNNLVNEFLDQSVL